MTEESETSNEPRAQFNAREIERRNRAVRDQPLNPVMKQAATATELAHAGEARRH